MNALLLSLLPTAINAIVGDPPSWLLPLLTDGVEAIRDFVEEIRETNDLSGAEKRRRVIAASRELMDDMDDIPGWSDLTEESRDRIIDGLTELVYQIVERDGGRRRPLRNAIRRLRKGLDGANG